ncbi:hypothetical protein [Frisingicoccus sp.]|uniref:hypothetical protein n=1 Tax=Frisingicoccus sp. TaxID=1918627 RepID=UPI003AB7E247
MDKLIKVIDFFVIKFWIVFCIIIFCGALVVKAKYHMADYPYFTWNSVIDIILLVFIVMCYYFLHKYAQKIENHMNYFVLWIVFGIIGILYVLLVPLKPFSDMAYVTEGAMFFSRGDIDGILASEYLQMTIKNIKVSMFYGILGVFLPKNILSFRVINVFLYLSTAHLLSKVGKNFDYKYPKIIFILVSTYLPLFMYCNHVYFDLPVLFLCTAAVYFYTKEKNWKNMIIMSIVLGIACSLRVLAFLFVVAIAIDYVFCFKKELFLAHCKKMLMLCVFVIVVWAIPKGCDEIVDNHFRLEESTDGSIWSLFWMGINEEEFGFMHNEIADGPKYFSDFYNLLISRNMEQNVKLFGRKIFWEWSQGTYQAQRYGFGPDATIATDKFEYETPVTRYLMYDEQRGRQFINSFCRAQYLALFFFMILGMRNMDDKTRAGYRMLIYLMFGTFLVLIFYELKSRYVMHCMIPMVMLAVRGLERSKEAIRTKNLNRCKTRRYP